MTQAMMRRISPTAHVTSLRTPCQSPRWQEQEAQRAATVLPETTTSRRIATVRLHQADFAAVETRELRVSSDLEASASLILSSRSSSAASSIVARVTQLITLHGERKK